MIGVCLPFFCAHINFPPRIYLPCYCNCLVFVLCFAVCDFCYLCPPEKLSSSPLATRAVIATSSHTFFYLIYQLATYSLTSAHHDRHIQLYFHAIFAIFESSLRRSTRVCNHHIIIIMQMPQLIHPFVVTTLSVSRSRSSNVTRALFYTFRLKWRRNEIVPNCPLMQFRRSLW